MNHWVLGVDIGGTHITSCLVNIHTLEVMQESFARADVNAKGSVDEILRDWLTALNKSLSYNSQVLRLGIAMPGPFDYEKGISYIRNLDKYESLYEKNVKALLSGHLDIPLENIRFINDASAYLLGELYFGAAKGQEHVVGITLGTGLGSAQWRMDELIEGDLWCTAFETGTAEDYLAARWLLKQYSEKTKVKLTGVKELAALQAPLVDELFHIYGENIARVILQRFSDHLPDCVVIGGNISKAWDRFISATENYFKAHQANIQCVPAALGEKAALLGAAAIWR